MAGPSPILLVFGATGFLGSHVHRAAVADGWVVVGTSLTRAAPDGGARVDITDERAVDDLVQRVRPAAVVNAAYRQTGPDAAAVNVDGAAHVARAAARVGARLVHVSTDVVFDGTAGRPYTEVDPVCPRAEYGRTKADAEVAVARAHAGAVLVRTSIIYGGPVDPSSTHEVMARDPEASFYVDELRCPVQVDDLAAAVVELCGSGPAGALSGPLHVAGADSVSRQEFAELVTGRSVPGVPAPDHRSKDCRLDSSRAAALLATRLRGVREVWSRPPTP